MQWIPFFNSWSCKPESWLKQSKTTSTRFKWHNLSKIEPDFVILMAVLWSTCMIHATLFLTFIVFLRIKCHVWYYDEDRDFCSQWVHSFVENRKHTDGYHIDCMSWDKGKRKGSPLPGETAWTDFMAKAIFISVVSKNVVYTYLT